MHLPVVVRSTIEAGPIGHIVTVAPDGSPQCSLAWLGLDGDEVVIGTMFEQAKLRNVRRDPRIAVSVETGGRDSNGLNEYFVLHGRARVTDGGAPALLTRLAQTYIGPGTIYPPFPNPPGGWVTHITVDHISGSDTVKPEA